MPRVLSLPPQSHIAKVFRPAVWRTILDEFDVTENQQERQMTSDELRENVSDYDAVITGWGSPAFPLPVLDAAPKLKLIAHSAGSVKFLWDDQTVKDIVIPRGIKVYSGNDAIALNVAESTSGLLIMGSHLWLQHIAAFKEHKQRGYAYPPLNGQFLSNSTVGLVSASRVARHVIRLLQPFSCRIRIYDPYLTPEEARGLGVELADLDTVFAESDMVSIHAPSIPATDNLIQANHLKQLRDGAILINTSRGSVIDQDALLEECRDGRIVALLDVTEPEPLPPDSEFWNLPNVALFPHISGSGYEGYFRIGDGVMDALRHVFTGRPFGGDVPLAKWDTLA